LKFDIKKDKYVGRNVIEVVVVSSSGPKSLQATLVYIREQFQRVFKQALIEKPPFCNYVFNYYSTINKVETTNIVAIYFLQLGNIFCNCKLIMSKNTS
jgi:hypothetical protein